MRQFGLGLLLFPIMLIPLASSDITINVDDVGSYFKDAFKCQFSGINSRPDDNCSNNLSFLIIYFGIDIYKYFNVSYD